MISIEKVKQRKIVQWALAYLAAAWLLLQLAQLLWDLYGWPHTVLQLLPVFLGIGLLVVLVLAWYHGEKGVQRVGAVELMMLAGIFAIAGGVLYYARANTSADTVDVATADAPATEQGSIAVLPFTDMSPKKDQAYFSDGLTEELLNVLAKVPDLRVAARTSSFSFRDSKVSIDSMARALKVEYVLEGSVRTAASRVRITAQLIKAGTGYHVWSETYDRDVSDIFAVQDEISKAIVDALRLKMGGASSTVLAQQATTDPEAHQLLLKGQYHSRLGPSYNIQLAKSLFTQAIERDPNYAAAHAWLGQLYQRLAYRREGSVAENYATAERLGKRALELDPNSAEGYMLLARIEDVHKWRFASAEKMFARAIELNPGLAAAYEQRAWLLMRLGRPDEAIASARRAVRIDPLSASTHNTLASILAYARQNQEATDVYKAALALDSTSTPILGNIALSYEALGNRSEAQRYTSAFSKAAPNDLWAMATKAYLDARAGRRTQAEAGLKALRAQPEISYYLVAMVLAGLGRNDEAFEELERAIDNHEDFAPDLGVDDVFDPLRADPRMNELLKRVGLSTGKPVV